MSRTASSTAVRQPTDDRTATATAAEVRQVYQALRTLVPDQGRVSAADLAVVTDLDRARVPAAMARLARDGPFVIDATESTDQAAWTVSR